MRNKNCFFSNIFAYFSLYIFTRSLGRIHKKQKYKDLNTTSDKSKDINTSSIQKSFK